MLRLLVAAAVLVTVAKAQGPGPGEVCEPTTNECRTGADCHPTELLCYPEPNNVTRPYIWLGVPEPACDARSPGRCRYSYMDFDMSHPRGEPDDDWCGTGDKARCVAPPATGLPDPTAYYELMVVSYDIFDREYTITHDGQLERTCRMPAAIRRQLANTDVVIWVSAFMGGCWAGVEDNDEVSLRLLMTQQGFTHHTRTVDDPDDAFENGGVFISSRWPITQQDYIIYQNRSFLSPSDLAAKGAGYARIEKTSGGVTRPYHIFGTLVQAGGQEEGVEVRQGQAAELKAFIDGKNIPNTEGVIIGGNLNANAIGGDTTEMTAILNIINAAPMNLVNTQTCRASVDAENNDVMFAKRGFSNPRWPDYVLFSRSHLNPTQSTVECNLMTHTEPFPVCWCEQCIFVIESYIHPDDTVNCATPPAEVPGAEPFFIINHLSDHHPIIGRFTFPGGGLL